MNHPSKFVDVYDLDTQQLTTIPAAELAPGMVEAKFPHLEKTCWVPVSDLPAPQNVPPSFKHPAFGPRERSQIQEISNRLKKIYPQSLKEWEDGFRQDENPSGEILRWLHLSETYVELVGRWSLTDSQQGEVFRLLVQCSLASYPYVLETIDVTVLPPGLAHQAVEAYYGQPTLRADAALKPACELPDPLGGTPLAVISLENPEVREQLEDATIVFGVDSSTGEASLFFGKGSLAEVTLSGDASHEEIISFLYDGRTEELEWFYAAIRVLKGSCCYEPATQG